jgi:hypothetical protein
MLKVDKVFSGWPIEFSERRENVKENNRQQFIFVFGALRNQTENAAPHSF